MSGAGKGRVPGGGRQDHSQMLACGEKVSDKRHKRTGRTWRNRNPGGGRGGGHCEPAQAPWGPVGSASRGAARSRRRPAVAPQVCVQEKGRHPQVPVAALFRTARGSIADGGRQTLRGPRRRLGLRPTRDAAPTLPTAREPRKHAGGSRQTQRPRVTPWDAIQDRQTPRDRP